MKYSKRLLIKLLSRWIKTHGYVPKMKEVSADVSMPHSWTYQKYFGSWSKAVKATGFTPRNKGQQKDEPGNNWKGGKYFSKTNGVQLWLPSHPNSSKGYIAEHRFIVEKKINRYLKSFEIVHHKNLNPKDNDILNLQILTRSEHTDLHNKLRNSL